METLGIFVKYPQPGTVKTRLAETLGAEQAAALYESFVIDIANRFRSAAEQRVLGHTPSDESACQYFQHLAAGDFSLWAQPPCDLGERMSRFFEVHLINSGDSVVLIGSDSPTLPRDFVDRAFRVLRTHDVVLGPATDGGYYLIGQTGQCRPIFDGVDWSSPRVLDQTIQRMTEQTVRLSLLPVWYDVDTADDLDWLRGHIRAIIKSGGDPDIPRTFSLLKL